MSLKTTVKYSIIVFTAIIICSLVITIIFNRIIPPTAPDKLFQSYLDYLFYVDMIFLLIGLTMFIGQSGAYNSISYSTNLIRSSISKKYRYTLMESAGIESNEISNYLKETYLFRKTIYKHTYTILIPSVVIFFGLLGYAIIFY